MTISKKLKSRSDSHATLQYVYRGEKSHPVLDKDGKLLLDNARHIGGPISSSDPFQYGEDCKPSYVNIDELASELDLQVTKYRGLGSGKNLIQHYVVSLAPGETLTDKEWRKVVKMFMDEMGYGNDTIYTACVHTEKDHEHAHIVACRVRHNGKLVPNKNDYAKAVSASRKIEKEFCLKFTANPDQTMGVEPTRKDIELDRKGIKLIADDPAVIIRKRIATVFDAKKTMPQMTMSDFVNRLTEQGVKVKVKLNNDEQPIGINYSLDGDLWISGSKIKKTRTTWSALLAKENIDYNPERDNVALGIGVKEGKGELFNEKNDIPYKEISDIHPSIVSVPKKMDIQFYVRVTSFQKHQLQKNSAFSIYRDNKNNNEYALLIFTINNIDNNEVDGLYELLKMLIELILKILMFIFGFALHNEDKEPDPNWIKISQGYLSFDTSLNSTQEKIINSLKDNIDFITLDMFGEQRKNNINKNNVKPILHSNELDC